MCPCAWESTDEKFKVMVSKLWRVIVGLHYTVMDHWSCWVWISLQVNTVAHQALDTPEYSKVRLESATAVPLHHCSVDIYVLS